MLLQRINRINRAPARGRLIDTSNNFKLNSYNHYVILHPSQTTLVRGLTSKIIMFKYYIWTLVPRIKVEACIFGGPPPGPLANSQSEYCIPICRTQFVKTLLLFDIPWSS